MRRCAWIALLWIVQLGVAQAQADARRGPALNWVRLPGSESCITAAELALRVEERLERRVFVLAQDAELAFDGYVQPRAAGGFTAHLAVANARGDALGARDIESTDPDCRKLDDALVLITALTLFPGEFGMEAGGIALDPDTNARLQALFGNEPTELDPESLPAPTPAPAAAAPAATLVRPPAGTASSAPRVGRSSLIAIEASPVLAFGVLPGIALGIAAELTVRIPSVWPTRVGFGHFFERDARAEALPTGTSHFTRDELMLFTCPLAPDEAFAFELCAGAVLGLVSVASEGFAEGGINATDPVLDIGGQAGVRALFFDVLLARLTATALLPLVQRSYDYQALDASTEQLFRSAQVGARLQLSVGAEF
jgi:hypothetical protein